MNPGHVLLTVQDDSKQQLACQIKRVIPGEVHLLAGEPVLQGSVVEAELEEGCRVNGRIVGCLKTGSQYLLSFRRDAAERRQERRFPVNQPGWLLPSLQPDASQIAVRLRDVSRNGVGVDVPDLLPIRSAVVLKTTECFIFGTVQYCVPDEFGFKMGIRIDEIFFRGQDFDPRAEHPFAAGRVQ